MISVIIPTLNEELAIERTLKKLRTFTLPHEIIVSDGGSTDRTVEIAKHYIEKILVYTGEKRQTIAAGRNLGAQKALGDFLVFMDADCEIYLSLDEFFKTALENFEKKPNLVGLTSKVRVIKEKETFMDKIFFGILNLNIIFMNNVMHRGEAAGEFQMVRRSAFEKIHGYREDLSTREDGDLFMRLSHIGHTYCDTRLTIHHSGRRAHAIGWLRLLYTWLINVLWVSVFNRTYSKEWKPIR